MLHPTKRRLDVGISGFGVWQISAQQGGAASVDEQRYRLLGAGPEASMPIADRATLRIRAQWEFAARDIVRGNNLWAIDNYRFME